MKSLTLKYTLLLLLGLLAFNSFSQELNSFEVRYQDNIRGDLTFIANNILNRDGGTSSTEPNDPYNVTGNSSQYNDFFDMQYIDIDGDPSTFSSSTSTFTYPQADCNLIRYAGLYWSGIYPSEEGGQVVGTNRQNDFDQVKFKVPGGSYVDIFADEILFDGFTSGVGSLEANSPYACYADVTSLVTALANPEGDYTIANVRAVNGSLGGGASAGWTLVIVYENPTLSGKYITTYDGFARVRTSEPQVEIDYTGFNTVPSGPVVANITVAALEGDNRVVGDGMSFKAASNASFSGIWNAENPINNFFNSNITINGTVATNRTPASINTLGYDTDILLLDNAGNSRLPNGETAATFRFTSTGDQYYPFFNAFNVEIIEPNIVLEKKVQDIAGNDITGLGVNLGQNLDYVLSYDNVGNDDAANVTIRDVLPINVDIDLANMVLPPGVTYTYDAPNKTITFNIPDASVTVDAPVNEIRIRVEVAENCFDFVNACSTAIENIAFSTYEGVLNDAQITDDPSVSDFDNCGFVTPGATNFLLDDLDNCDFSRTVELCGEDVLLDSGDGFDTYIWYIDENGDGVIDAGDTVITDGDPDGDPSTLLVTEVGTYIVDKIIPDPCKGFQEIITVTLFGTTQSNPISALINDTSNTVEGEIVVCPNDGEELPQVFLCGLNDTELIQINIPDADSIDWEMLDETSCAAATADCANKNNTCTWNSVGGGANFMASDAGHYRVVINYQNGCFSRFYFDIYKNPLDPQYNKTDIICNTPGNITVNNLPATYDYQLLDATNNNILVPFSANNGPSFDIASNGAYTIEIQQQGVSDGCVFRIEDIGILSRDFQVTTTTKDTDCNGLGEISLAVLNVPAQYYYKVSQGGVGVDTFGPSASNNHTFNNLNPGTYDVEVTTDDGCLYNGTATIGDLTDLAVNAITTKSIDCLGGTINVTGSGGFANPNYFYAIWSYNGTDLYPNVGSIPPGAYQTTNNFDFDDSEAGDYEFIVVDSNNCTAISNVVTIGVIASIEYTVSYTDETCHDDDDGTITVNVTNSNGYAISYVLDRPAHGDIINSSGYFDNLEQGPHELTITISQSGTSCDLIENITIGGPTQDLDGDAMMISEVTCLVGGTIEAQNVVGGTPPYSYSIDNINFVTGPGTERFTNLPAGDYFIYIRDANSCEFTTNDVELKAPDPLDYLHITNVTEPLCPSETFDIEYHMHNGGEQPFVFEIISPSVIPATSVSGDKGEWVGLSPGSYVVQVTDAKGCTIQNNFTVNPVQKIAVTGQLLRNADCAGDSDGRIRFNITNFIDDYSYEVTGPNGYFQDENDDDVNNVTFIGLEAGVYTMVVTDRDTNCTATASVVVEEPAPMTIAVAPEQPKCTDPNGGVVITSTGGWGGNTYRVTFPDGSQLNNSTGVFGGLDQLGTYTARARSANGCTINTTFELTVPVPPVVSISSNFLCYTGGVSLELTANVDSGGVGPFEYSLDGSVYGASNVFSVPGPGTYTINVRDAKECIGTAVLTVDPELDFEAYIENIATCANTTDVDIVAAGGDGLYQFAVVPDGAIPTAADFQNFSPVTITGSGDYDVYVRDNAGAAGFCEEVFDIVVEKDDPIAFTATVTDASCFGGSDGAISILMTGGRRTYEYSIDDGANYQIAEDFVNLPAGTYPIRVRDFVGCQETGTVVINEPTQLVAEAQLTQNYTCLQLGEITVGGVTPTTGGSGNYQYSINGGAWSVSSPAGITYSNLVDDTYSVRVRDAAVTSCFITLPDIVVPPLPTAPVLTNSITYNCDGSGNITILPNDPSYTYSLNAGAPQASNVFANVASGNHIIEVDYGSDCTIQTNITVASGNALGASIVGFTNISCNGGADGSITFEIENFDPINGFEYQINGGGFSAPQTSSPISINTLSAIAYTIEVRDVLNNGCSITLNQNLSEPAALVASAIINNEITCENTGATIAASAIGGTAAYQYQLENNVGTILVAYQAGAVFNSLASGDYLVRVRDANGCIDVIDAPVAVVDPTPITFTSTPTACYSGNNDGTVSIAVTAGNGDYQFSLNSGPWLTPTPVSATNYTFSNLAPGTYTVDVQDGYGCAGTQQSVTITQKVNASAVLNNDLTCSALANVTVNASGGSGTYTYEWSNDGGTTYASTNFAGNVFTTNAFGNFMFRVTDTTAPTVCVETTNTVVITAANQPVITSVTPTDILCNGDNTGILDVVIDTSVGVPPYTINVYETGSTTDFGTQTTGLPAGNYEVRITDDKNCVSDPYLVSISEPALLTYSLDVQPITCDPMAGGTDPGSITVENAAGGTLEYTYHISGNNGFSDSYTTTSGGEDYTFTILDFGIYQIDVTDVNGCSAQTSEVIASPPTDLDIDVSSLTASCALGGSAAVQVTSAVGSGNYEFAILKTYTSPYAPPGDYQPADLPGGDTSTFTGLIPGVTYTFVVHDLTTLCYYFETADAPINSPSSMTATLDKVSNVTCTGADDGSVDFTFNGYDALATDVSYEIFNSQSNVSTGITGTAPVNPPGGAVSVTDFGALPPGVYYLLLSEVGGPFAACSVSSAQFTITESTNLLQVTASSTKNDNCLPSAGVISAQPQYGTGPYSFQYLLATDPAPTATTPGWVSNASANVESGNYIVYVKDNNSCIQSDAVTVLLDPTPQISVAVIDECVDEGQFQALVTLDTAGITPYQISVNGGAFQNMVFNGSNQYTVSGLSSGLTQSIEIRDLNGCSELESFDIQPPLQFNATLTALLDCEVAPANNAEITINVLAGSTNYDYEITGPVNEPRTALLSNPFVWTAASAPGTYTVTVYDNSTAVPNCLGSILVDVPPTVAPAFTETHIDITCNAANDGSITLTPTDTGVSPLTFSINPVAGTYNAATKTFENLPPNTYDITATGVNSCTTVISGIVINEPAPITFASIDVVDFGCSSGNNANNATTTIDVSTAVGGSGNYTIFEFVDNQGTPALGDDVVVQSGTNPVYTITDPAGGSFTVNIYDDMGCVGTATATVAAYDEITTATAAITNPISCTPGNDGEITINATSTNADPTRLEYSMDNGATYQASNVFGGLGLGNYSFIARHIDTGCSVTITETLTDPATFTIGLTKINDIICYGTQTGSVTFELVDASYVGPFDWAIYETNGTPAILADDTLAQNGTSPNNGPTAPILLFGGEYRVDISQNNFPQCSESKFFNIVEPNADITANVNISEITCDGNNGVIRLTDVLGGWGGYNYYVGTTPPASPAAYVGSKNFTALSPGTYEAWVIDSNDCERMVQNNIVLDDPTPITATLQKNQDNCTGFNGELEVVGIAGGQGSDYSYQILRNGTPLGPKTTSTVFTNLGEGSYVVNVTDQWNCPFTTAAVLLYSQMNPQIITDKEIDCSATPGGSITIDPNGGSGFYDFTVTFPDGTTTMNNTTGVFTNLDQVGIYNIDIEDTATIVSTCNISTLEFMYGPSPVIFDSPTVVDASCFGVSDGAITVNLEPSSPTVNNDPAYTYNLYDNSGGFITGPQASPTFNGLASGTYLVEAVSAKFCSDRQTVTVNTPTVLEIAATATPYGCAADNSVNNAVITVSILDGATTPGVPSGTGPYLYSLDNVSFQTQNTFVMPDTGATQNLTVYVVDDNGCGAFQNVTIEPLNVFTATVTKTTPISCANPEEVLIEITDDGNLANTYTFDLLPIGNTAGTLVSNPNNTSAIFNLTDLGDYTFRITDNATGCTIDTPLYVIAEYDVLNANATATTPVVCFGESSGGLELEISASYTGTYSYEVFGETGTSTGVVGTADASVTNPITITGIPAGNHFVRVTELDFPFCTNDSDIVTIVSPNQPLTSTIAEVANVTCTNDIGEISITPNGGYAPYDITLTNTTTGQTYSATDVGSVVIADLSAGDFDAVVTDAGGCILNLAITLVRPNPITADINAAPTTLVCYGNTDASVWASNVVGGQGIYQYQLNEYDATGTTITNTSGIQNNDTFNNLGAGIYSITVSDGWSCGIETAQIEIIAPIEVGASLVETTDLTCTNLATITLTASGGAAPYTFSVDGVTFSPMSGGSTHVFSVSDGTYQYFVRDALGCESIISNQVVIEPIEPLTIDLDLDAATINCTGEATASIIANTTGGLGNYSFELFADAALTTSLAGPQASDLFSGLTAGTYYVQVTSDDCVAVSNEVVITDPVPLQIDRQEFTNVTCAGQNDGTITIEVSGGTGNIFYAISPNLNQFDTENTFVDLSPGTYDVIAQDANGCFIPFQFTIDEPTAIVATAENIMHEVCVGSEDGSFDVTISGGTAPYSTALNSNNDADYVAGQTSFTDLAAGTYVVFIKDAQDCEVNVIVEIEPGVNLNALVTPIYVCTGSTPDNSLEIILDDDSVLNDVMYALDSTDSSSMRLSPDFNNIAAGDHYLTIAHSNGCINTIDFEIQAFEPLALIAQENNINEITAVATGGVESYTFYIDGENIGAENTYYINRTDTYTVTVIDQSGCEATADIFIEFIDIEIPNFFTPDGDSNNDTWSPKNLEGFPNVLTIIFDRYGREIYRMKRTDAPWEGLYQNSDLPSGDYWYVIKINGENDDREFVGHFTLYR